MGFALPGFSVETLKCFIPFSDEQFCALLLCSSKWKATCRIYKILQRCLVKAAADMCSGKMEQAEKQHDAGFQTGIALNPIDPFYPLLSILFLVPCGLRGIATGEG